MERWQPRKPLKKGSLPSQTGKLEKSSGTLSTTTHRRVFEDNFTPISRVRKTTCVLSPLYLGYKLKTVTKSMYWRNLQELRGSVWVFILDLLQICFRTLGHPFCTSVLLLKTRTASKLVIPKHSFSSNILGFLFSRAARLSKMLQKEKTLIYYWGPGKSQRLRS